MNRTLIDEIITLAHDGADQKPTVDLANEAKDVIRTFEAEMEARLERTEQLVTRQILEGHHENLLRSWYATRDGGYETRVRDDVKVIVMWGENPGYPDPAYALVVNPFGPSRIRVNLASMADLDDLIRLLSIPPMRPAIE